MDTKTYEGESFLQSLPVESATETEFMGVTVTRLCGTKAQIDEATAMIAERYPMSNMCTFDGKAFWLGTIKTEKGAPGDLYQDFYELVVLRASRGV